MLGPDITIKRGDTGKVISGQFRDASGTPVDCTGNTSRKILMKRSGELKINSTFEFTDAATGTWSYTMTADDVDMKGKYKMELEVTLPGPQVITFPTDEDKPYLIVLIQEDLG